MKKNYYSENLYSTNKDTQDTNKLLKTKTTNVNVLLNRVRLERKKNFNKKVLFLITLAASISLLAVFIIYQS